MELWILNDLLRAKAIDKELYAKAVQKVMTAQKEKVKVKLTLEMNVEEALAAFECETVEDVVDCTVQELSDLFTGTYSGLTITESEIVKTGNESNV